MLWQRILFGSLMLAAAVGLFAADGWLGTRFVADPPERWIGSLARGGITTVLVLVLSQLALAEWFRLARGAGFAPLTIWPHVVAGGLVLLPWLSLNGWVPAPKPPSAPFTPAEFVLTAGVLGTIVLMVLRQKTKGALSELGIALLAIVYLGYFASFVVRLRCAFPAAGGAVWVAYFIVITKLMDIGGYLIGHRIGKTRLIPEVSPGKSVEGFLAGVACAVVGGVALGRLTSVLGEVRHPLSFTQFVVFSVVMAIVSQFGDLAVSLIKRDVGQKNSGNVVPSFGGYLDIVDSPLLTAPVAWWLLTTWQHLD